MLERQSGIQKEAVKSTPFTPFRQISRCQARGVLVSLEPAASGAFIPRPTIQTSLLPGLWGTA